MARYVETEDEGALASALAFIAQEKTRSDPALGNGRPTIDDDDDDGAERSSRKPSRRESYDDALATEPDDHDDDLNGLPVEAMESDDSAGPQHDPYLSTE